MKSALRLFAIAMIILFAAAAAAPSPTTSDTVTIVVSAAAVERLRSALPAAAVLGGRNAVVQLTTKDAADLRLALALALGERPVVTTRPPTSAEKDHSDKDGIEQRARLTLPQE